MIRSLWTVVSVVAVANLLALLGFAGWLVASDRLDVQRLERIREMLAETRAQQEAREQEEAEAEQAAEEQAEATAEAARPPAAAAERLDAQRELEMIAQRRTARSQRAVTDYRRTLEQEWAQLQEAKEDFARERAAFEAMRDEIVALEGDEQFKKTLRLYESLKPDEAANLLRRRYDQGDVTAVVTFLDAMQTRSASKVIAAMEPEVAADLLERLRTHGLRAEAPEEP